MNPPLSDAEEASSNRDRGILRERALALGRVIEREEDFRHVLEVVEFDLASEHYAFPIAQVREVCLLRELVMVPCTPAFVLGIVNLRGELLTIIDLKKIFDLPPSSVTALNRILVLRHGNTQVGILADSIRGIRHLHPHEVQPALPTLTGDRADFLHGITSDHLVILDAIKILSDKRLLVDEEVSL